MALDTEAPSQRMENNIPANRKQKKVGITTLKSEKQRRKGNKRQVRYIIRGVIISRKHNHKYIHSQHPSTKI